MTEEREALEITLSDIIRFCRKYFLYFFVVGIFSGIAGYVFSFTIQNQYTATALVLPEYSSSLMDSGLGELASLTGFARRNRTEAVRPDLFPEILNSTQCIITLLSSPVVDQKGDSTTLLEFLDLEGEVKPFSESQLNGQDSVLYITRDQRRVVNTLKGRISVSYGKLNGILTIQTELSDAKLAAEVTRLSIDYLNKFVTDYRTGKESRKVQLLEEQTLKAKEVYQKASAVLNSSKDRNRNIFTHTSGMEIQNLELEFQRSLALYSEIVRKLELARLQVEENALVLKVLEPPVVPYATSKPRRLVIAVFFMFLGFLGALSYVLFVREKIQKRLLVDI